MTKLWTDTRTHTIHVHAQTHTQTAQARDQHSSIGRDINMRYESRERGG